MGTRIVVPPIGFESAAASAVPSALRVARCAALDPCPPATRILQQPRDAPVAVPSILRGQGQDRLGQLLFVRAPQRLIALGSSPLPHYSARPSRTHHVLCSSMLHRAPTSLRA